jgi:hypothetical protein
MARSAAFKEQDINLDDLHSNEPSNMQSVNTLALTHIGCGRACKLLQTTKRNQAASLPDELNAFYARFEASNTEAYMRAPAVPDNCVITLSVANVFILISVKNKFLFTMTAYPGPNPDDANCVPPSGTPDPQILKKFYSCTIREHSDRLHYRLVWQLLGI